jgi:hypothetical protein
VKNILLTSLFLLLNYLSVCGQNEERNKKSDYPFIKPEFILDGRRTLISEQGARLGGFRVGIEMNRVNRFGFGFYSFSKSVRTTTLNEISSNIISADLELKYASIYYERVLLFTKKYEWSSTLHFGVGNVSGSYTYADGSVGNYEEPLQLTEISTTLFRHLTYFMSIGAGVGYRQTRNAPEELLPIYNAPVFLVKLRFQPIKAVRGIWNKDIRNRY